MHAMLGRPRRDRTQQISRDDQVRIRTADTARALLGDTTWAHVADTAADTGQTEVALRLLLVKTVKGIVDSQLLHPQKHRLDRRIGRLLDNPLLIREGLAISVYRFVVVGDVVDIVMVVLVAMLDHIAVLIHMSVHMFAHFVPPFLFYYVYPMVIVVIVLSHAGQERSNRINRYDYQFY